MKITRILAYRVELPLHEVTYKWSGGKSVAVFDSTIVRVETDEGLTGHGEVCPLGPSYLPAYADGMRAGLRELGPSLIGEDPRELTKLNRQMDAALKGHPYVKSGIDIACWDILGQACEMPVCELLGGRYGEDVPLYRAISQQSPEEMAAKVAGYRTEGYRRFQLKVGGDPDVDIERIRAVAARLQSGDRLVADANTGWVQHEAVRVAKAVRDVDVYIEQPCLTYEECLAVRRQIPHPFVLDENIDDLGMLLRAKADLAMDVVNLKISKLGGLTKARQARDLCVSMGIAMTLEDSWGGDITTAAIAHLAQSTPTEFLFTTTDFNSYVTVSTADGAPRRMNGRMAASTQPGLGIAPKMNVLGEPVVVIGSPCDSRVRELGVGKEARTSSEDPQHTRLRPLIRACHAIFKMQRSGLNHALSLVTVLLALGYPGGTVIHAQTEQSASVDSQTIKDYGLRKYIRLAKDLPHVESATWKLVCEMPYNCQFQPWIEAEAPAGKEIRFDSSNPLVGYLAPTETCLTEAGQRVYEAKKWISGEGAIYTIPAGVTVRSVQYRETGYNTTFAGSFECNDEDYNILWKKAARTAYLCMRDHFYDCPDRERVGFWGDGTPELDQCFYIFDSSAHLLAKKLVLRKLEPKFYPGQILEFLGPYGLWFYYLQTGDLDSIRAVYDQTRTFLLETYQFGNPHTWFDWGKEIKDTAVIETCFYYIDLKTLREMALATGHEADVPVIDARLENIKSTFDSKYWKGNYYMSAQVSTPDDRANAMVVNAGLADRSKWAAIHEVLTQKTDASCFFDRWVFEALCTMGKQEYAMLRMYHRYQTMIPCSISTLWEHYDRWWASRINVFDAASSLNHGWNPPAILLSQTIAGISPEVPGWSTYHVLPKEAFLTSIKCVVPSLKGKVTMALKKTAVQYSLTLTSPLDTTAIVGIPKSSFTELNSIKVNGITTWSGTYVGGVKGISWNGEDANYVKFNAMPGTWEFLGLGALPLNSPKPLPAPPPEEFPLDKKSWTASASAMDGVFPFSGRKIPVDVSAANALDGDHWTGWRDMTKTQYPGQWFQVDMEKEQSFHRIVLDNTWALWDSPVGYSVSVSNDGIHWSQPIATGSGNLGITNIIFPEQKARYLRITQTGTSDTDHWSIYELDVYR